jgi:putative iron-dependent peroxidase
MSAQPGILHEPRPFARYLTGRLRLGLDSGDVQAALSAFSIDEGMVVGLGPGLTRFLGLDRPLLRQFPALSGVGLEVPSTQADVWIWLRDEAPGPLVTRSRVLTRSLVDVFEFDPPVDGFKNEETESGLGRDLTGYEDGTENPVEEAATAAALAADGSSYVAVQMWKHDLPHFATFSTEEQDDMIGRRRSDNVEFEGSPASAHVKRTAQESFEPEAFILRRSLPWAGPAGEGLMFVAFGKSFDAYEVQMRRMVGEEDGIVDACFRFSRPRTGGYYWCAPVAGGHLNLG